MAALPNGTCIDRTEVTVAQYGVWLATGPDTADQPSECAWNTRFEPEPNCMTIPKPCKEACDERPVVCINWCDAYAYCKWAGKRLCGAIVGGSNPFDQFANASSSEWYAACTSGGVHIYAFGDKPSPSTCNDFENPATGCSGVGTCERLPVGSLAGCQSPEPAWSGVFDMSGNVWEWEDSCEVGLERDLCRIRGGSYVFGWLECASDSTRLAQVYIVRSVVEPDVGFRCCMAASGDR